MKASICYDDIEMENCVKYENIYSFDRAGSNNFYVEKYLYLGIKNTYMEMFVRDCRVYRDFETLYRFR